MSSGIIFCSSLGAQFIKNLPAMRETSIPGGQDPLEKGVATHSSVWAWRFMDRDDFL